MNKNARFHRFLALRRCLGASRRSLQRTIITVLLALVTLMGWTQEKPDTITINFQLASKIKGEMVGVLYPDFMDLGTSTLQPATDDNGQWTVKIPAYRTLHIQLWTQIPIAAASSTSTSGEHGAVLV